MKNRFRIGKFLITLILLCFFFFGEISVEESEPNFNELEIESIAFVNNPNGIQLYSIAGNFKTKTSVMHYQNEFELYGSSGEEIKGKSWRKVKFEKKDFYILESDEFLQFDMKDRLNFALVQDKILNIYQKPFTDAKKITELKQFSIVETFGHYKLENGFTSYEDTGSDYNKIHTWYKIKTSEGLTGFILNGISREDDLESVKLEQEKKGLSVDGFCQLVSHPKNFYSDSKLEKQIPEEEKKIFGGKQFLATNYSFEKNQTRYYNVKVTIYSKKKKKRNAITQIKRHKSMRELKYNTENYEAFLSEKDCKFYSEKEYSDYTVSHTQFKGDKKAILAMKQVFDQNNFYLDYADFKLIPLNPKSSKFDSYFLGVLPSKDKNDFKNYERGILLKKVKNDYQVASNSLYPDLKLIDLDKDGIYELFEGAPRRADISYIDLYIFNNGKYISIKTILPKNEQFHGVEDNLIHVGKTIYDKDGQYETTEEIRYKYQKGKLIRVK